MGWIPTEPYMLYCDQSSRLLEVDDPLGTAQQTPKPSAPADHNGSGGFLLYCDCGAVPDVDERWRE